MQRPQRITEELAHHGQELVGNGDAGRGDAGAQLVHRELGGLGRVGHAVLPGIETPFTIHQVGTLGPWSNTAPGSGSVFLRKWSSKRLRTAVISFGASSAACF